MRKKSILVIAIEDKAEALRVANGLSILHEVKVVAVDGLDRNDLKVAEQLEAMEFAEIPLFVVHTEKEDYIKITGDFILESEEVFMI